MRIAFNATLLLSPLTGIGQYAFELARRLAASAQWEPHFFYRLHWSREVRAAPLPGAGKVLPAVRRWVPQSYALSHAAQNWAFQAGVRRLRPQVYLEPAFVPYSFDGPTVVTVHDLSWIRHPECHPPERVRAMERYFEPGLKRASVLLTDSEFVKREIVDVFGFPADRIVAIPLGADRVFHPRGTAELARVLQPLQLEAARYFLAVGTLEPRKNLVSAIRAHAALPEATRRAYPLIIAGLKGWGTAAIEAELAPRVARGEVRLTGYLERDALATLVAGATALVYPSLYEGFGLPPLEAMACGVPVITSNAASLPEVVGDAGIQLDALDVDALRDAMAQLAGDPALRAALGSRGLERAGLFSWDRCAAETFAVCRRAAAH